ncbi:MAG: response regulator transcription factor [Pontiellaceae bacterium]|jgi:DNA-binding NarL/FixJ family response regulator|nr:response regulator transcription factor [Pontiellaceae bacterium]
MSEKKRILIVDDHQILRRGLAMLINMEPDMEVCGEAEDVPGGIDAVMKTNPDLVLTDISLKNSDGVQLIKQLHAEYPRLPLLAVSMHDESIYAERALRAGARGYITKQVAEEKIIEAIHQVLSGKIYLHNTVSEQVMQRLLGAQDKDPAGMLSDREFEVFCLIGRGLRAGAISEKLNLSIKTVETYQANIKVKLNLASAKELSEYAVEWAKTRL